MNHSAPELAAPDSKAKWSIIPQLGIVVSPIPRKLKVVSESTDTATTRIVLAKRRGRTLGRRWWAIDVPVHPKPMARALSMKGRSLIARVWA